MNYIGIDPGKSGGIALLKANGDPVMTWPTPDSLLELWAIFKRLSGGSRAVLERVWTSPQMGVVSAGTFMRNVGNLEAFLTAAAIPYDSVTPARWQGHFGCLAPKGTPQGEKDKNITKRAAQRLFPDVVVTHHNADALLIAEYCRRLHIGSASFNPPVSLRSSQNGKAKRQAARQQKETADQPTAEKAGPTLPGIAWDGTPADRRTR